jgi:TatD DNase family protein
MKMLIDTHCHLEKKDYPNLEEIISHMNGNIMIASGENLESSIEVEELTRKYDNIYGTIGFHPNELENFNDDTFKQLEELLKNKKIVGIGEIGLDYHYDDYDKEKQKTVFIKQIELAIKYKLPIVIHSRDAAYDTLEIIKKYPNLKIDMHCYGYSLEIAKELLKINQDIMFGIGGVLTFKNSKKIKEVVEYLDMKNILLETDSPFLSPEPLRGTKNEPYNVKYVAEYIANMKNIDLKEVSKITSMNAISQFDLNLKK